MQFCVQDLACEVKMLKNINSENLDCWQQRKKEDIIVIVFVVVIVVVTLDNLDEEKSEVKTTLMRVANLESNEPQFFLKMSPMGRSFSSKLA